MVELFWKLGPLTEPGIYLRSNPAASSVVRQDVYAIDGQLRASTAEGPTDAESLSPTFLWFGPIPAPTDAQREMGLARDPSRRKKGKRG